jgi:hypothetical protein
VTGPGYDVLVVVHVLSAVIGFGAVGATGTYAGRARSVAEPRNDANLRRYFRPGTNWAERVMLLTPALGAALLFGGDRSAVSQPWPWIGLGCWVLAAGAASAWCWPAERRIQAWLSAGADSGRSAAGADGGRSAASELSQFRDACRVVQRGAFAIAVLFLVAVVVMIGQPR